ncbi:MAG: RnfABCDGE type electron transport complex subunit C [Labilibaculum sp.]|nr:RnfABCDGE type electron transport complex subunit C [Labilibaculum sp.]
MLQIPDYAKKYKGQEVQDLPDPEIFLMPLNGYKSLLTPVVQEGEQVRQYQLIAKSGQQFGTYLHAPVSGTIGALKSINESQYLTLHNDFKYIEQKLSPSVPEKWSKQELLNAIKELGIVGCGGARFPSHIKFNTGDNPVDFLVVNGIECEPFFSADYALIKYHADELAQGIKVVKQIVSPKKIVVAIKRKNKELKEILEAAFLQHKLQAGVRLLPNHYPQGEEFQLIGTITGHKLSKGCIPSDFGVVVSNVATFRAIAKAIFEGKPNVERITTLYNEEQKTGANFLFKIGTPIAHIVEHSKFIPQEWKKKRLRLGGAMMGKNAGQQLVIHQGTGGLIYLVPQIVSQTNCINCGYCTQVCPQYLMPMTVIPGFSGQKNNLINRYNMLSCIECAACEYSCPSKIPLLKYIRQAKSILKQ